MGATNPPRPVAPSRDTTQNRMQPLNLIYFYLTEGCNLRCRHCWIAPEYDPSGNSCATLPLATFDSIIAEARPLGLSSVKLTGGEPLLHPQIGEILDHVRAADLRLIVETNGVLCTPELARQMAACKGALVSVSLDGADAPTHEWMRRVDGSFEKAIQGIRNLVAAGFRPQVIMTLTRKNVGQMEALVKLAGDLGAGSVKFNVVQPHARGKNLVESGETLAMEELVKLGRWVETDLSARAKVKLYFDHPPAFRTLKTMFGSSGSGCAVCGIMGIIGVLADGSYALCGIGETVPELVFGNAAKERLADVWHNNSIMNELREGMPGRLEGVCGDCSMKVLCKGSCIAHNYATSRNLWAPYWYCEEARKKGLFPETRVMARSTAALAAPAPQAVR
jgi:SynChlorMet cassette radical SAM/SPASM protein ScmF